MSGAKKQSNGLHAILDYWQHAGKEKIIQKLDIN